MGDSGAAFLVFGSYPAHCVLTRRAIVERHRHECTYLSYEPESTVGVWIEPTIRLQETRFRGDLTRLSVLLI